MRHRLRFTPAQLSPLLWLDASRIPTAVYASDTFPGVNSASSLGNAESGQAWVAQAGTWGISGTKAYTSAAVAASVATLETGQADGNVEVVLSTNTNGVSGLVCRLSNATNFLLVRNDTTAYGLYTVTNGTPASLGSFSTTPADGDKLFVQLSGSSIGVWLNGTLRITASNAFNQAATKHGLYANNSIVPRFDNFSVRLNGDTDPLVTWPRVIGTDATQVTPAKRDLYTIQSGRPVVRAVTSFEALGALVLGDFSVLFTGKLASLTSAYLGHSSGSGYVQQTTSTTLTLSNDAAGTLVLSHAALDTGYHVLALVRAGSTVTRYLDGVMDGTGTLAGAITLDQFGMRGASTNPLNGDKAALVVVGRGLSDTERRATEQYLKIQWGTP